MVKERQRVNLLDLWEVQPMQTLVCPNIVKPSALYSMK